MARNILIVDDEVVQTKFFEKFIKDMHHNPIVMNNGSDVLDFFINKKPVNGLQPHDIDVMVLDLSMPDIDGMTILKKVTPIKGDLQIIVLTTSNDVSMVIKAINLGAVDYIVKGEKDVFSRILSSINNALDKRNLKYQVSNLERRGRDQVVFSDIIGKSNEILKTINLAKKVANSTVPVLIEGPVGSGKELIARAIHGSGDKSGKPFILVDCETMKNNIDKVLFGSAKTLDNGVTEKYIGKIREASGGTLFLKNINALRMDTQIKLLHFIQDGEVESITNKSMVKVYVRIISSTSKDLCLLFKEGKFREDLYYRISIFPIDIPSLKERGQEDIKALAESFCYNFSINENKKIKGISDEALNMLYGYDWENNVKQLRSYVFRAVILCDEEILKPKHFPQVLNYENDSKARTRFSSRIKTVKGTEMIDIFDENGICKSLSKIEEEVVQRLVDFYNGNLSEVSKQLRVGRSTIYRKLKVDESLE